MLLITYSLVSLFWKSIATPNWIRCGERQRASGREKILWCSINGWSFELLFWFFLLFFYFAAEVGWISLLCTCLFWKRLLWNVTLAAASLHQFGLNAGKDQACSWVDRVHWSDCKDRSLQGPDTSEVPHPLNIRQRFPALRTSGLGVRNAGHPATFLTQGSSTLPDHEIVLSQGCYRWCPGLSKAGRDAGGAATGRQRVTTCT